MNLKDVHESTLPVSQRFIHTVDVKYKNMQYNPIKSRGSALGLFQAAVEWDFKKLHDATKDCNRFQNYLKNTPSGNYNKIIK